MNSRLIRLNSIFCYAILPTYPLQMSTTLFSHLGSATLQHSVFVVSFQISNNQTHEGMLYIRCKSINYKRCFVFLRKILFCINGLVLHCTPVWWASACSTPTVPLCMVHSHQQLPTCSLSHTKPILHFQDQVKLKLLPIPPMPALLSCIFWIILPLIDASFISPHAIAGK